MGDVFWMNRSVFVWKGASTEHEKKQALIADLLSEFSKFNGKTNNIILKQPEPSNKCSKF